MDPRGEPTEAVTGHLGGSADAAERLRRLLDRPLPPDQLAESTRIVAQPAVVEERNVASVLVVRVGSERMAIELGVTRRVVGVAKVHRVPHRESPVFAGIAAIDGELLLVARVERLFGIELDTQSGPDRRMLVIGDAGRSWALTVDAVEGLRRVPEACFLPPPPTVARAIDGVTHALLPIDEGPLVALLDGDRLLRSLERSMA